MRYPVESILTPMQAAQRALIQLTQGGAVRAAAVWLRQGGAWILLGEYGAIDALPPPDALDQGRLAGPDGSAHALCGGHAWLIWRGQGPADPQLLVSRLAAELEGARLREQLAEAERAQQAMLEIDRLAASSSTLEFLLPRLHRELGRLLEARHCQIALFDEENQTLRFALFCDAHQQGPAPDDLLPLDTPSLALHAELVRSGRVVQLDAAQLAHLEQLHGWQLPEPRPESWQGMPLFSQDGRIQGVLVLQTYPGETPYCPDDLATFQFVGHHLGFALSKFFFRAQLERQVWLRTCELEGLNARLRAEVTERQRAERMQELLFRIAELSNTSLSLEGFLGGVHRCLAELVEARNCLVALYDQSHNQLSFPYYASAQQPGGGVRALGSGRLEQVLYSGRPLLVQGLAAQPDANPESGDALSWLGVPLFSGRELVGVLAIFSRDTASSYTLRDQEVLEFVANHIGTALARVRTLERLQLAYGELEQRVRERTSELDAVNAQLQFDSLHDPLTRLPNRTYFARTLRQAWERFCSDGERFAVMFIDLDRFKLVNDALGHLAGDHLLFEAGGRIRSSLRQFDFLARLGGDEFAVILAGTGAYDQCEPTVQRVIDEFARPIILSGREVFSSASIGVVLADREHHQCAEDMLRDADHAMYRTKQSGRQGYTLFNHQLRSDQADQLQLEAELRRALDEGGQLLAYYQPFVDAHSGELRGFEALVRWQHPERGMIQPAQFLPVAEETGLITRIDRLMIDTACAQLLAWREAGRIDAQVSLHINLASANFHDPQLVPWLASMVERYRLAPDVLHLEITETALIDVPEVAQQAMLALHQLGIRLALDDFGTGYSALSYLHRYHFDVLKIDQAFVAGLVGQEESRAIVRAILAMASALSLEVVAEGVENDVQLALLREMGCAQVQGYHFARPRPADEVDWVVLAGRQDANGNAVA